MWRVGLCALIALALSLQYSRPTSQAQEPTPSPPFTYQLETPPIHDPADLPQPFKGPLTSDELSRIVVNHQAAAALGLGPATLDAYTTVELIHTASSGAVEALVEGTGGSVKGSVPGLTLASVPIDA